MNRPTFNHVLLLINEQISSDIVDRGMHSILEKAKLLITLWHFGTPDSHSHYGIEGNELADQAARSVAQADIVENIPERPDDIKQHLKHEVSGVWQKPPFYLKFFYTHGSHQCNFITWTNGAEGSFIEIEKALVSAPILCSPDFSKPFIIECDASDKGVGGILRQNIDDDYKVAQKILNLARVTSDLSEGKGDIEQKIKRITEVYSSDDEGENEIRSKMLKKRKFLKDSLELSVSSPIELTTSGPPFAPTPFRGAYEVPLSDVVTVKEQNKQILVVLNNTLSNILPNKLPEPQVSLPVRDYKSINQFEAELQNEDFMNSLVPIVDNESAEQKETKTETGEPSCSSSPEKYQHKTSNANSETFDSAVVGPRSITVRMPKTANQESYRKKYSEESLIAAIKEVNDGMPKREADDSPRENPFKNNLPGDGWYKAFMKRHPDLTTRKSEGVSAASSAISEQDIRKWFDGIHSYLSQKGYSEVLEHPEKLFNADETNFQLCPQNKRVIAPKGTKNVYEVDLGKAKTTLTVLFTFSAAGSYTPPLIIYPVKDFARRLATLYLKDYICH
ncbi:hypothetical protein JTB14_018158 [Gonioctena quinquepunctata]|nr:hypothetical protein JTB14_018158 [Gonioctena quinquepunctata]